MSRLGGRGAQRAVSVLAPLLGALVSVIGASRSGIHAPAAKALAWAVLAAVGLSLLLHSTGRRVVAVLEVLLGAGLVAVWLAGEGHWSLGVAGLLVVLGGIAQFVWAPGWPSRQDRYQRNATVGRPTSDLDTWKALDAGLDPTSDDFDDSLTHSDRTRRTR